MRKAHVKMNKSVYLGVAIFDLSKIQMYEFWYNYTKNRIKVKIMLI